MAAIFSIWRPLDIRELEKLKLQLKIALFEV
jgi:hypothetical protein